MASASNLSAPVEEDDFEGIDISKITVSTITPLKGKQNMEVWRRSLRANFHLLGLIKFIDGTAVKPTDNAAPSQRNRYRVQNATAYIVISKSVEPVMDIIKSHGWVEEDDELDPQKLYTAACKAVGSMSAEGWCTLAEELFHINATKYFSLYAFITRFHYIVAKLKDTGFAIPDKLLQALLLCGSKQYDGHWVDMLRFQLQIGQLNYKTLLNLVTTEANEEAMLRMAVLSNQAAKKKTTITSGGQAQPQRNNQVCELHHAPGNDECWEVHLDKKRELWARKKKSATPNKNAGAKDVNNHNNANRGVFNFESGVMNGVNNNSRAASVFVNTVSPVTMIDVCNFDARDTNRGTTDTDEVVLVAIQQLALPAIDYEVMHRRLMHASADKVIKACKLVGIKVNTRDASAYRCKYCCLGKSQQLVSHDQLPATSRVLQCIHVDFISHKPTGIGGKNHAIHIVDHHSAYHWYAAINSMSDSFTTLTNCIEFMELHSGALVQEIRINNDTEFNMNELRDWRRNLRKKITTISPDCPQQNPMAKRAVRTIVEGARTANLEAGFPEEYWPLAEEAFVHVLNRLPTAHNVDGKSSMQALGESLGLPRDQCIPRINHLRMYGAIVFVHIHDMKVRPQSCKMLAKAIEGKLCGYEGNSGKIYRIRLNKSGRIVRARDAQFIEELVEPDMAVDNEPIYEATFKDVYHEDEFFKSMVYLDHEIMHRQDLLG